MGITILGVKSTLIAAEKEAMTIAEDDIVGRMQLATRTLRRITPVDTGYAASRWKMRRPGLIKAGYIQNDAEYIKALNDGHSKQAPKFFIQQALLAAKLI